MNEFLAPKKAMDQHKLRNKGLLMIQPLQFIELLHILLNPLKWRMRSYQHDENQNFCSDQLPNIKRTR